MSAAPVEAAMACPLCGHTASPQERVAACARCPFRPAACQAVCCARCGYSWVESSRWVERATRWWRARRSAGWRRPETLDAPGEPLVLPVARLAPGEEGQVAYIHSQRSAYLQRLTAFGLMPGRRLRLRQTRPALIVQVGETELALDPRAGGEIFVRRPATNEEGPHA